MANLEVSYLGLKLKNPLVPSASPLSKTMDTARHLEDAGASALVMYSLFEEQILAEEKRYERFLENQSIGHGEASSFLPDQPGFKGSLDAYLEQLSNLKEALDIPVIASLNGISEAGWIDFGKEIQQAGADALELNVYYIAGHVDDSAEIVEQRYLEVLDHLCNAVSIPVAVKLSSQFTSPLHFVKKLQQAGAAAAVIFNRFYQSDINLETLEVEPHLQLSSPYESLLRVHWAALLRGSLDIDLGVTGGFHDSDDVIKALLAGADIVQLCSVLLNQGPERVTELLAELDDWLDEHEYESVVQMQGSMAIDRVNDPSAFERQNYIDSIASFVPPPGVRY